MDYLTGKSGREQGQIRAEQAIGLTARIGWVNADLLAGWIWPRAAHRRKMAEALLRRLVKSGHLMRREIDGRAALYVLTEKGAMLVPEASPGTSWGIIKRGQPWRPPLSFGHHLLAAQFLVWAQHRFTRGDLTAYVAFETELRSLNGDNPKYPDGLLTLHQEGKGEQTLWIEVEQARKTTRGYDWMIERVMVMSRQNPPIWRSMTGRLFRPTDPCFVLPGHDYRDPRGYAVDQRGPIRAAIKRWLRREAVSGRWIFWAEPVGDGFKTEKELVRLTDE